MAKQFDIVVIGGGLVGASSALSISKKNPSLNIAVIEANQVTDYFVRGLNLLCHLTILADDRSKLPAHK